MERDRISAIVLGAPAWLRMDLGGADTRLRERAADALAATITSKLHKVTDPADLNQVPLPLDSAVD